jgi:tetratricopeptide (TPR) repeat protein
MPEPGKLSVKRLRAALKCWDDAGALGTHELCAWAIARAQRQSAGYDDTPAGRGLALRALLAAAIEDLRQDAGDPRPADRRWRTYLILHGRYLEGRVPDYLAEQLAVSRSTYNHAQLEAEKALLARLVEWEERQPLANAPAGGAAPGEIELQQPFMAPPRRSKGLIGREALYHQVRQMLVEEAGSCLGLWGLPGAGKTALAVELSHDPAVRGAYPDGVLWIGLGAAPDLAVQQHLVAGALGLPHELLAALDRFDDRARAIQNAISGRRMLVVLDDVWRAEHALAFQLGGESCIRLLTTRSPGLIQSLPEYQPVEVPELELEASLGLLEQYAPAAVRARRAMLAEAIEHIGGLPLTMVLVGGYLRREAYAGQPRRLAEALGKLRAVENWGRVEGAASPLESRPDIESGSELTLFGVIGMSERELGERARRALYALAPFPAAPASFSEALALDVAGGRGEALDELVDAGLLEAAGGGRYRLHGAVLQYALREGLASERSERFVSAVLAWMQARQGKPLAYEAEAASIQRALELAGEGEMAAERADLAHLYFQYLKRAGLLRPALDLLAAARAAAAGADLQGARLTLDLDCGQAAQQTGDYVAAQDHYSEALELARELGDEDAVCAALQGLGSTALSIGELGQAGAYFREGQEAAEASGLVVRQAAFLSNLGTLAVSQGEQNLARERFEAGLVLARAAGDPAMAVALLSNLGTVHAGAGDRAAAEDAFQRALALAQERSDRVTTTALLANLGALAHEHGDSGRAQELFQNALELAREHGDRARTSQLLANLGALMTAAGEYERAERYLKEGLAVAEGIGHREHAILLRINLAELAFARRELQTGLELLQQAGREAEAIKHKRYQAVIADLLVNRMTGPVQDGLGAEEAGA